MAKNTISTVNVAVPADFSFESFGHTLTTEHLSNPATLLYLISNGFKQSLSDAAAMSKAEMEKAGLDSDEAIEEAKSDKRGKRFDAIIAGDMVAGAGGGRARGLDAYVADLGPKMARAFLEAQAKSKGKALPPRSSDDFKALVQTLLGKAPFMEKVRTEAQKRMDEDKALAELSAGLDIEF